VTVYIDVVNTVVSIAGRLVPAAAIKACNWAQPFVTAGVLATIVSFVCRPGLVSFSTHSLRPNMRKRSIRPQHWEGLST
jgi:NhaP-type Na+/H+ or K+/H+ antiporter